jgi:hypothetical protein
MFHTTEKFSVEPITCTSCGFLFLWVYHSLKIEKYSILFIWQKD